jgi:hypothetical protein
MQLESLVTPTLIAAALAAVTGGAAKVWNLIQQGRLDCLERCAALTIQLAERDRDIKALQLEVRDLLIHSSALRHQNAKLSGRDSDRP